VHWLIADILTWHPSRHYEAWHDRAVFHFLTADQPCRQYLRTLDNGACSGAVAVFGCFAPDGPLQCSGLAVARYSPAQLAGQLGANWLLISQNPEEHVTPAGTIQPFTWVALRRQTGVFAGPPAATACGRSRAGRSWLRRARVQGAGVINHIGMASRRSAGERAR
jgi:hypothetical protein